MIRRLVPACLVLSLLTSWSVSAQPDASTKQTFVGGLIAFMDALGGTYGDEGIDLRAALDQMDRGLIEWDARIWVYETLMTDRLAGAEPPVAADMHTVMGALYLERGRLQDATSQLAQAAALDPERADIHVLSALAHEAAGRAGAAADELRQAVDRDATDPVALYLLAGEALELGTPDEEVPALRALQPFLQRRLAQPDHEEAPVRPFLQTALVEETATSEPLFPPARYLAGFTLLRRRSYEEAIASFRRAVEQDPLIADRVLASNAVVEGIQALKAGRLEAALRLLEDAVAQMPASAEAHRILGTAYWYEERYRAGAEQLQTAVTLDPENERARVVLADVLVDAGRPADAERVLQQTLDAIPGSAKARYRLGRLYQSRHRYQEALQELEEAARLGPIAGSSRLYESIGTGSLSQLDLDGAVGAYRRRLAVVPNDARAHYDLGDVYRRQDRPDAALAELFVSLLLDPDNAATCAAIGQLYLEAGRFDEALPALRRAVTLDPEQDEARYALATTLIRLGRTDEGREELATFQRRQADAMDQERRDYETNLLRIEAGRRTKAGAPDEAVALWRQVVDREPEVTTNHVNLALALMDAERYEEAVAAFNEALRLSPDADIHGDLARAYERLGRTEESRRHRVIDQRMRAERARRLGAP